MKLGWMEWRLMNHPLRPMMQKHLEARQLLRMGGPRPGATVLEIGCGNGGGVARLFDDFKVRQVDAFDLDPRMVGLASRRHRQRLRHRTVRLWRGSADAIPVKDAAYDAVFDFGVLHHVIDWHSALEEIHRVLKPGGRFYIEEISRQFIVHPLWRMILDHPQENRFDHDDLMGALRDTGFQVRSSRQFARLFIWCVADRAGQSHSLNETDT